MPHNSNELQIMMMLHLGQINSCPFGQSKEVNNSCLQLLNINYTMFIIIYIYKSHKGTFYT